LRDCPVIPKDWWVTCLFGGCNEFQARFRDRINPDPTRDIVFDRVNILNQTLYVQPNVGNTVQQAAQAIAQQGARGGLAPAAAGGWRVELWTRPANGQPARLVAVVGDYDPAAIQLEQTELGSVLAFTPGQAGAPPMLGATWQIGGSSANADSDADQDGLPDGWETRYGLNPDEPADASIDADDDGVNNLGEFQSGTDPRDGSSVFRIVRLEHTPQAVHLEFIGAIGRHFQLEKTLSLGGEWVAIGPALQNQGGLVTFSDLELGDAGHGFYRVRLVNE
jgi:hypothetical protein